MFTNICVLLCIGMAIYAGPHQDNWSEACFWAIWIVALLLRDIRTSLREGL